MNTVMWELEEGVAERKTPDPRTWFADLAASKAAGFYASHPFKTWPSSPRLLGQPPAPQVEAKNILYFVLRPLLRRTGSWPGP
jgi:hypothetical protein